MQAMVFFKIQQMMMTRVIAIVIDLQKKILGRQKLGIFLRYDLQSMEQETEEDIFARIIWN